MQTLAKPMDFFFMYWTKEKTSLSIKQKIYVYITPMFFCICSFFHDEYSHKNDFKVSDVFFQKVNKNSMRIILDIDKLLLPPGTKILQNWQDFVTNRNKSASFSHF